jgi:hypothetical protein
MYIICNIFIHYIDAEQVVQGLSYDPALADIWSIGTPPLSLHWHMHISACATRVT